MNRRAFLLSPAMMAAARIHAATRASSRELSPLGACPSPRQLAWQRMQFNGFIHFGMNTFTNKEWGDGSENPNLFDPTHFDPDQIVLSMKASGMKGVILVCKHHDGFCLWPTKSTQHSVRSSRWRNGQGDVVRDISDAARRHGMKFGVYSSPWDRNNPAYGTPAYLPIYRRQLTELLTHYGPVFEVWFDGANGGTGYYGGAWERRTIDKHTYYGWPHIWALVRRFHPDAVIFSDAGPDVRWVGNERGVAGDPCWETFTPLSPDGRPSVPGDTDEKTAGSGVRNGRYWMPAECDVSIRPGWFWHASQNSEVKTPNRLLDLYYESAGRGATLLLNVPPTREGMLDQADVASLREFGSELRQIFRRNLARSATLTPSSVRSGNAPLFGPRNLVDGALTTFWAPDPHDASPALKLDFQDEQQVKIISFREAIEYGQRIGQITVERWDGTGWTPLAQATSIGSQRLIRLPAPVRLKRLRVQIKQTEAPPALTELGLFAGA
jgi:alpha-L-fucosidase